MQQLQQWHKNKILPSISLLLATAVALIASNTFLAHYYYSIFYKYHDIHIAGMHLHWTVQHAVNDILMVVFFFSVGLELKYELMVGSLCRWQQAVFPLIGAAGGMLAPALIYYLFNRHDIIAMQGWAIPLATDIAFALGALACFRGQFGHSLTILLMAIAIFDDLAAILIIAFFYSAAPNYTSLLAVVACVFILILINRLGYRRSASYIIVGIPLWYSLLNAGIHPTLAGVITALAIPLHRLQPQQSMAHDNCSTIQLYERLSPYINYAILPIFALANAGVDIQNIQLDALWSQVVIGITCGLCLGKPLGICSLCYLGTYFKVCQLPSGCSWRSIVGLSFLCGIGFTMSLFIGDLAFSSDLTFYRLWSKVGVLCGSFISAVVGFIYLSTLAKYTSLEHQET